MDSTLYLEEPLLPPALRPFSCIHSAFEILTPSDGLTEAA